MKKILMLVSVVAVAGAVSVASAMDRTGKIGLGAQESFASNGGFGTATLGSWSIKYGIAHNMTGQFVFGFDFGSGSATSARMAEFGARFLYDVVEMENSDFYVGLGVGWNQDKLPAGARVLRMQVPLGFEWSFAGLPEVGFNAEVGIVFDYNKDASTKQIYSLGGKAGGNLGLGIHYYF